MIGGIFASLLLGFIPMFFFAGILYWLDRYEKEPLILLVAAFLWGAVVSSAAAFILNSILGTGIYLLSGSESAANFSVASIIAPIIEEGFKGAAVFMIFLIFRSEFDSILDGIIYGAVTALGFAATENAYYIFSMGFQVSGWSGLLELAFIRVILVGWQHPFYTAFTGIGLAIARLNRPPAVKIFAPLGGYFLAIFTHSLHNTLAPLLASNGTLGGLIFASQFDWLGWLMMLFFVLAMINREKKLMQIHLIEEVKYDIITQPQYDILQSFLARRILREKLQHAPIKNGQQAFKTLNQQSAELVHKKNQYLEFGDETGNLESIQILRKRIYEASLVLRPLSDKNTNP